MSRYRGVSPRVRLLGTTPAPDTILDVSLVGDERLWRVTVSGIGAEWFEGTGSSYAIQPGGAISMGWAGVSASAAPASRSSSSRSRLPRTSSSRALRI